MTNSVNDQQVMPVDVDVETKEEAAAHARSLKRTREGSVEPGAATGVNSSTPPHSSSRLAIKKHRIEEEGAQEENENDENIGEVREQVEKLSHEEAKANKLSLPPSASNESVQSSHSQLDLDQDQDQADEGQVVEEIDEVDSQSVSESGLKRKMVQRTPSSQPVGTDIEQSEAKRVREDEPPTSANSVDMDKPGDFPPQTTGSNTKSEPKAPSPPATTTPTIAKPTQPTFSSFSSTASPFAAVKPSATAHGSTSYPNGRGLPNDIAEKVRQANALPAANVISGAPASASANTTATPAVPKKTQPSFGSFSSTASPFAKLGSSSASLSTVNAASGSASPFRPPSAPTTRTSAFGGWSGASASPFATPKAKTAVQGDKDIDKDNEKDTKESDNVKEDSSSRPNHFHEALAQNQESIQTEKAKLDLEEQELHTGEEDEDTLHQVRSKLYYMDANGGWKERGIGSLHLNVKKEDGSGARLVMRAEGVLRLILNVALFAGMTLELTDKYVKTVVMEEGKMSPIAIKTSTAKAAAELHSKIMDAIPVGSGASGTPQTTKQTDGDKEQDAAEQV